MNEWKNERIFHLYGDVTIAGEGLQNLGLCSVLMAFEQGRIFIVQHLLWHGTSVFPVSSKGPSPFSRLLRHTRECEGSTLALQGHKILNILHKISYIHHKILNIHHKILNIHHKFSNIHYKIIEYTSHDIECTSQDYRIYLTRYWIYITRFRIYITRYWIYIARL
jgi:hypothetical protein